MSASKTLTRGPLPPQVYWRRRLFLGIGAVVLVFLIAQLLNGGSDGKSGGHDPVAQQAGAPVSTTTSAPAEGPTEPADGVTDPTGSTGPVTYGPTQAATGDTSAAPMTLAAPSGTCRADDITIVPEVDQAVAGSDVTVKLSLQTTKAAACNWQVSKHVLAVKIVRHGRVLWTSQQCATALPDRSVVIRNVVPSIVTMVWDSRRSTEGCPRGADFVRPGPLSIYASTLGGEPGHSEFDLVLASAQTAPVSPKGNPTPSSDPSTGEPRR